MIDIESILSKGETQSVEFKKSLNQMREACKSLCGMLNTVEGFGRVIFGISPENEIVGLEGDLDSIQKTLVQHIKQKFEPSITISLLLKEHEKKNILILSAKRAQGVPYYEYDGRAFIKEGSTKRILNIQEKEVLNKDTYLRDILNVQEKDLERILFDILKQQNNYIEIHFLKNIFDEVSALKKQKNDLVDTNIIPYFIKIFVIWKILNQYDAYSFAEKLITFIHKFYIEIFTDIDYNRIQIKQNAFLFIAWALIPFRMININLLNC